MNVAAAALLFNGNVVMAAQGKARAQQVAHLVCVWTCARGTNALHMTFVIHTAFARGFKTGMCWLLL